MGFLTTLISPLFDVHPALPITIIAVIITLITSLLTKYVTDQQKIKRLKKEIKSISSRMRENQDDPQKIKEIQSEVGPKQMALFKESLRPMMYTAIPLLIVIAWMSGTFAYNPIEPNQSFTVTAYTSEPLNLSIEGPYTFEVNPGFEPEDEDVYATQWQTTATETGTQTITVSIAGTNTSYEKEILVTENQEYIEPERTFGNSKVNRIVVGNEELKPFGSFSIFGWRPGWLGAYIIISIVFGIAIRKILDIA